MTSIAAKVLIAPIRFYQRFITPYTPATCRYYPTCSAYAVTALRTRGAFVGTGLTIWRLLRCNPWSSGGVDHVPAKGHSHPTSPNQPSSGDVMSVTGDALSDDGDAISDQEDTDSQEHTADRERQSPAGSSPSAGSVNHRADDDLDVPHSAAPEPMIGRSAA